MLLLLLFLLLFQFHVVRGFATILCWPAKSWHLYFQEPSAFQNFPRQKVSVVAVAVVVVFIDVAMIPK